MAKKTFIVYFRSDINTYTNNSVSGVRGVCLSYLRKHNITLKKLRKGLPVEYSNEIRDCVISDFIQNHLIFNEWKKAKVTIEI